MKLLLKTLSIVVALFTLGACAQSNTFVKGTLDIKFNSHSNPAKGVKDVYNINVNVSDNALFVGTITDQPQLLTGVFSKAVSQPRQLEYNIECDVVNPAWARFGASIDRNNRRQVINAGRMYGIVPIGSSLSSDNGVYQYDNGTLVVDILPIGRAQGFSSKFTGTAVGKPMGRPANWLQTLQLSTVKIVRNVNGKTSVVSINKYDKMEFRNQTIGAGPLARFTPVIANGEMLYDYDKSCWFFNNNFTMQYSDSTGNVKIDRVTGTIRWDDKANEYAFDVRVNEPLASAGSAFDSSAQAPADASAFFETDNTVSSLSGTMAYKDTKSGDTTLASQVTVDLTGNKLTLEQTMALGKIVIFSAVVPMNSD